MSRSLFILARSLLLLLLTALLVSGCSSSAPKNSAGKELTKKLYLDANLEFSLTVPEDWDRRFVTTPHYSTAPYAVLWSSAADPTQPENTPVEIQATVMKSRSAVDQQQLADLFIQSVPGFTSTTLRPLEDALIPTLELMGHSAVRSYRVLFIQDTGRCYQLSFSAPPEAFEKYRPIFDMVLFSFAPLE